MKVKISVEIEFKARTELDTMILNKALRVKSSNASVDVINAFVLTPIEVLERSKHKQKLQFRFDLEIIAQEGINLEEEIMKALFITSTMQEVKILNSRIIEITSIVSNTFSNSPLGSLLNSAHSSPLHVSFKKFGEVSEKKKKEYIPTKSIAIQRTNVAPVGGSLADGNGGTLMESTADLIMKLKHRKGHC